MPMLTKAEAQAVSDLIAAGEQLWQSSLVIHSTQGRSIMRTDVAMVSFKRALDAAKSINQDKLDVAGK